MEFYFLEVHFYVIIGGYLMEYVTSEFCGKELKLSICQPESVQVSCSAQF
jgi:hypothetical protein